MDPRPDIAYEFGPFRLDPAERQLWRGGEEVSLTPKAYAVLALLVRNSGRTLTKDDFMREVWPDTVVEEGNLADNISIIRQALGDDAKNQRYIKTVPTRGYRFVAEVAELRDDGLELLVAEKSTSQIIVEQESESPTADADAVAVEKPLALSQARRRRVGPPVVIACVLLGGLLLFGAYKLWTRLRGEQAASVSPIKSIAVLPFKPLAAEGRDEYLELGMADALITKLSSMRQVLVRPTSAVRGYTDLGQDPLAAGRELTVDSVLDGSLQRVGDRLRVTVRLLRVADGASLWAERFDEKFTDIFSVQDSISQRVAGALTPHLTGEERERLAKRYTESTEAYQLYQRGRYHWNRRTADGLMKAVEYLGQAVTTDPNYALAHAGLADAYALLPEYTDAPLRESMAKAKVSALRALEIDETLAEAHVSLAYIKQTEWDWSGVEEEYRRGLDLNPNYATGHQWYSEYLVYRGRLEEAISEVRRAQELDPLSLVINARVGINLYYSRRYDEALEQLRKTLEFNPEFILTNIFLYSSFYEKGMHREAIPHIVRGFFNHRPPEERAKLEAALKSAYESSGSRGVWEKVLEALKGESKHGFNYNYTLAETYIRLGDKDEAFRWLQKATEMKHPGVAVLKVAPVMDGLRADPRFAELLRGVGIE